MPLYPVAGCKFYISTLPFAELANDAVSGDYGSVAWIEVKKWTQMGTFGDSSQLITTDLIGENRTKKQKGTKNAGSMANTFAIDGTDTGQLKVLEAAASKSNYAFKIELNDKLTGPGVNSTRLMYGLVMMSQNAGGGANTVQTLNATMEINSNITTTAPTILLEDGSEVPDPAFVIPPEGEPEGGAPKEEVTEEQPQG